MFPFVVVMILSRRYGAFKLFYHSSSFRISIHLHRASGFSVSSKAHPSPLTPTLTCSWGWSSAIEEKHFFILWTTNKPLQNCMHMSHTCLCNEQRATWHSWYDPVQITTVKFTLWPWHTWKSKFLWEFSQAEDNRAANPVHQPSTKTVGTSCAFLPSIPERCSSCLSLMNCHGNDLATPLSPPMLGKEPLPRYYSSTTNRALKHWRLPLQYGVHQARWHIDLHRTFHPVSTEFV